MKSFILAAILVGSLSGGEPKDEIPKLSVSGTSTVKKEPDLVTIRIGVEEEDKNADIALQKTSAKIAAIVAAVKGRLDKAGSLSTDTISLSPIYEPSDPKRPLKPAVTIGYRASSTLNIRTEDLKAMGGLIDISSSAGANRIDSITFSLKDDRAAKEEALTLAAQNAIASAETLAKAAGIRLKRIINIQEESGRAPIAYKTALFARGAANESSFPVEPGEVEVSANVALAYEMSNKGLENKTKIGLTYSPCSTF